MNSVQSVQKVQVVQDVISKFRLRRLELLERFERLELASGRLELASGLTRRAFSQIDFDHLRIFRYTCRRTLGNLLPGAENYDAL
jgi:hypothetical protein